MIGFRGKTGAHAVLHVVKAVSRRDNVGVANISVRGVATSQKLVTEINALVRDIYCCVLGLEVIRRVTKNEPHVDTGQTNEQCYQPVIAGAFLSHIVRGVRDSLVQILPKVQNLAQRSPMSYCLDF